MTDRNLPPEVEEALQEHEASLANHVLCPPAGECSDRCMDGWTTARAALRSAFLAALDQADEERSTAVAEAAEATFRARAAEAALSEAATMLERASGSATAPGEVLIYAQAAARARAVLAPSQKDGGER